MIPIVSVRVRRGLLPALVGLGVEQTVVGVDGMTQVTSVVLLACENTVGLNQPARTANTTSTACPGVACTEHSQLCWQVLQIQNYRFCAHMMGSKWCLCLGLTCDGCPTHQVGVGEVEGGVEQEVRLNNPPRPLADVIEQACAAHGHSALVAVLQEHRQERITQWKNAAVLFLSCLLARRVPVRFWEQWLLQTFRLECAETSSLCSRLLLRWQPDRQEKSLYRKMEKKKSPNTHERLGGPHVCQVFQCRTLLLGYHSIQQHSLGPVQGCRVLHHLHAVI